MDRELTVARELHDLISSIEQSPSSQPSVSRTALTAVLQREYGLEGTMDRLGSERDETFRLNTAEGTFLVKAGASGENSDLIDLQVAAISYLADKTSLPVPTIQLTTRHEPVTRIPSEDGVTPARLVHVMQFLPGCDLASQLLSPDQAERVGRLHGELTLALRDFHHQHARRHLIWDLMELPSLTPMIDNVEGRHRHSLARKVMHDFETIVVPMASQFEQQIIHGDYSVFNLLGDPDDPGFITGIVDFGDLHLGRVVFDLAIAVSNLIDHRLDDPWAVASHHEAGFYAIRTLPPDHRDVLATAAAGRTLQRLLISQWRAGVEPSRADYVLGHSRHDWSNLEAVLDNTHSFGEIS